MRSLPLRRVAVAALLLTLVPAGPASAARPHTFLLAADAAAGTVTILDEHGRTTGTLHDVALDAHAGTLQLTDGRILLADSATASLDVLRVDAHGTPTVAQRIPVPGSVPGERVVGWMAVDAGQRYLVAGSDHEDSAVQQITVVDLADTSVHQVQVTTTPDAAGVYSETQPVLAGNPLQVVVTTGGQFTSFPLDDVLADRVPQPSGQAPLGAANHGPAVAADGSAVFSTAIGGVDGVHVANGSLVSPVHVDYSATVPLTRVVRPRMDLDGRTVIGAIAEPSPSAASELTHNHLSVVDTLGGTSTLLPLGDGTAGRVAVSHDVAAVSLVHPAGDTLRFVDLDPRSPEHLDQVGIVQLPSATSHAVALDAAGDRAYVTSAGTDAVSVVDVDSDRVTATWRTATAPVDGGYLTVLQDGRPVTDLVAR
jgi:hypothetical protein